MQSIVDGNDVLVMLSIILGITAWGLYAERHRVLGRIPGVVWILTTGLALSNLGVIPMKSPVYDFICGQLMPLGIPLLLYKASLRSILRDSGMVLPIFLVGAVTVCIGAAVGFYLLDLGPIGPKVAATYAAGWIGGASDFVAMSQITGMTPTEFSVALGASAPVSILGLLALLTLPSLPFVRRHIRSKEGGADPARAPDALRLPALKPADLVGALALSGGICVVSGWLARHFAIENYTLFIVSVLAVVAANVLPRRLSALEGDFDLGMLIMYLFFAAISAGTDATSFFTTAPLLFFYGLLIIGIHLLLLLLVARWFRFDLAETVIGSGANIVGAAAAAGVASSKGWTRLITPAITTGMLGKAIANFFGIALFRLLG